MSIKFQCLILFIFLFSGIQAQELVWTEPQFPTQTDDITLYFDAKKGNGDLAGVNETVYMHAGVITTNSSSPTDWKFVQGTWGVPADKIKMTAEGDDIYSKTYNITDFYGLPPGVVVEKLAFVFRNASGSIAGRSADGSDIYLDVYPPDDELLVDLITPVTENTIVCQGEVLKIAIDLNKEAQVTISKDGVMVFSEPAAKVEFDLTAIELGNHQVDIKIEDGNEVVELTRRYFVIEKSTLREDPPVALQNGLNYTDDSYIFQLSAPQKDYAFFLCSENDYDVAASFRMTQSRAGDRYWIELPKSIFDNGKNTYQYFVDGNVKIADPFSTVVLDPLNDNDIPADVKETLPAYPVEAEGIVTAFDLEPSDFQWTVDNFDYPENTELIIYEIMMRDFLADKNYKSLLDTLDYLSNLGINAIELMPISEFEGNQSWGYNPSFHMAVDKYYGTRDQLKAVIDACHTKGIAVILDVVFNHAFSQSPLCQLYWNTTQFRPSSDSPYLNEVAKHPFNVGYDFNHESSYTKEWVKQVLSYWMEEFHFDGFRFDLSKGLTQTFSSNDMTMAQYDQSRVDILKDYADHIWAHDSGAYVIMEHFADNSEEKELASYGMMLWGNHTFQFAEAAMGYSSELDWADYKTRGWNEPNLIAYMESHDEERMGFKLSAYGNASGAHDTQLLKIGLGRTAATNAIYFSLPGPKMLWQFGELGYDESINRCLDGTISNNCRLDPKPVKWEYLNNEDRRELYYKTADMLYLRNNYPVFQTTDYKFSDDPYLKLVHLNSSEMNVVTMANFNVVTASLNPNFQTTGTWYEYFTGEKLEVVDTQTEISLGPGEHRVYLSEEVMAPNGNFNTTKTEAQVVEDYIVSPNPVHNSDLLTVQLGTDSGVKIVEMRTITGHPLQIETDKHGDYLFISINNLTAGSYLLVIGDKNSVHTKKIIVCE